MSILSVANVHFESTGANRIEYIAANDYLGIVTTGNISISSRNFTLSNSPGLAGNVLTSNGTTWISQIPSINLSTQTTGTLNLSTQSIGTINLTTQSIGTINLETQVEGVLQANNGGTGLLSPGTTGNVLTSNGTTWISQAMVVPSSGPEGILAFNELY